MKYVKFTMSNNYCGCDEEVYEAYEDNVDEVQIEKDAIEILVNQYSFYEPDSRFIDIDEEEDEEAYDQAVIDYQEECYCTWGYVDEAEWREYIESNS